jgi:hypothetical protein
MQISYSMTKCDEHRRLDCSTQLTGDVTFLFFFVSISVLVSRAKQNGGIRRESS